jgi:DNA polymerase III alpha subunit
MRTLQEKFIAGAHARSGVPVEVGQRVWQLMAAFAGYGFPMAHAASYALVSWRSAWCKAHVPAIFLASVLANWGGYYSQRVYLTEARRLGLAVRPPEVNHARGEFSVAYLDGAPALFMGLDQVRDLTRRTQTKIMKERPFHSLGDFLARADRVRSRRRTDSERGAGRPGDDPQLLHQLKSQSGRGGQLPLFRLSESAVDEGDWSLEQKLAAQQAILGAWVTAHPLDLVAEQIQADGALSTLEAAARPGQWVRVAGMRQTWQRARASQGEPIYWMALEDLEGMLQVEISANVFRRYRAVFAGGEPMVVEGEVDLDEAVGEPFIRAIRAWKIEG